MSRKIYTFCNLDHSAAEEYQIQNHPILALDDKGIVVGSWISSNHSYGRTDILGSLENIDPTDEIEWVDSPMTHPVLSKLL